jgi:pimeloyl-ACP methyl ester carboxylesterase
MTQTGTDRQPGAPREGGSRLWKWTKRVLVGFIGLVVVVLLAGVIYQFVATKIDAYRWYPPPTEMVDVGGSNMHLHCTGEEGRASTVVMDIGAGGNLLDWQSVQPGVAKFARVCTYDRGGAGWSDPGTQPRTSQQFVGELHALLNNAGVEGPYVLVGHSLGGNNVQIYASRYPDEVAGMVLVDPQFYNYPSYLDPEVQNALAEALPSPGSTLWPKFLATIGVTRLPYTFGGQTDERTAISTHAKNTYEALDETTSLEESAKERRAATVSLGDKPLMVLSAGARDPLPGASQEQSDRFNEAWTKSQADLTQASQNSEQIIAEDSTHNIQADDPELVIDAVRQVVDAVQNGGSV